MDDTFHLPYGFGFDDIIKEKAEVIDSLKTKNNDKMDELIEQLGFIDYRDALAVNKYILEAKRSGDYYQIARARVLEFAMKRMNYQQKANLDNSARQRLANNEEPAQTPSSYLEKDEKEKKKANLD
jgi:hypothetical protein